MSKIEQNPQELSTGYPQGTISPDLSTGCPQTYTQAVTRPNIRSDLTDLPVVNQNIVSTKGTKTVSHNSDSEPYSDSEPRML